MKAVSNTKTTELRQLGAILFVFGLCALIFPLKDSTTIVGKDGDYTSMTIALLVGDLCVIVLGFICMFLGYCLAVRDSGSSTLTLIALVWEQTVFIEWITGMVNLGKNMSPNFGTGDTNYFFTTGLLTMFFLCFMLYGAIGVILFAIYAIQTEEVGENSRTPSYYRGRLLIYSFMFTMVGLFRFLMPGIKVLNTMGSGPLDAPFPVVGGPIWFPEIDITLGITTILIGLCGMLRGVGVDLGEGPGFGNVVGFNYFLYVLLKVMVQIGYFPGEGPAGAAAMVSVVFLPGHIILAYLDDKAQEDENEDDNEKDGGEIAEQAKQDNV